MLHKSNGRSHSSASKDASPAKSSSKQTAPPPTLNTLPKSAADKSIPALIAGATDAMDLFSQLKQAHWNVRGANFMRTHELFDKVAEETEEWGDLLAERARQLGAEVPGSLKILAESTRLEPYPTGVFNSAEHIALVANRLSAFGTSMRESIDLCDKAGDKNSADIFTEISRCVDEYLWFVESHIEA